LPALHISLFSAYPEPQITERWLSAIFSFGSRRIGQKGIIE